MQSSGDKIRRHGREPPSSGFSVFLGDLDDNCDNDPPRGIKRYMNLTVLSLTGHVCP